MLEGPRSCGLGRWRVLVIGDVNSCASHALIYRLSHQRSRRLINKTHVRPAQSHRKRFPAFCQEPPGAAGGWAHAFWVAGHGRRGVASNGHALAALLRAGLLSRPLGHFCQSGFSARLPPASLGCWAPGAAAACADMSSKGSRGPARERAAGSRPAHPRA